MLQDLFSISPFWGAPALWKRVSAGCWGLGMRHIPWLLSPNLAAGGGVLPLHPVTAVTKSLRG